MINSQSGHEVKKKKRMYNFPVVRRKKTKQYDLFHYKLLGSLMKSVNKGLNEPLIVNEVLNLSNSSFLKGNYFSREKNL